MKGILFNLLEAVVTSQFGEDAWDDTLEAAGVEGAYTAIGNYGDDEFLRLLASMPTGGLPGPQQQLQWFGRSAMPMLAQRYDVFFTPHAGVRPFLLTLNGIVHPEVRKLYPGADVPVFDFPGVEAGPRDTLCLSYRSRRRLCWLAEGFILGAADHYEQTITMEPTSCMHAGADRCLIVCTIDEATGAPGPG